MGHRAEEGSSTEVESDGWHAQNRELAVESLRKSFGIRSPLWQFESTSAYYTVDGGSIYGWALLHKAQLMYTRI